MLPRWLIEPYERVLHARQQKQLPHALLLQGSGGWGEEQFASYLALTIIGKTPGEFLVMGAETLAHPDLRWIRPESPGGQISIDQVRDLAEFVVQAVQTAPYKVAVLVHGEKMNHHAANALLKTLEEPPSDSVLIVMTTAAAELLPTLRSRCQSVTVKPGSRADAIAWLKQQREDLSHTDALPLLFEYGAAPLQVLTALTQEESPIGVALSHILARPDQMDSLVENWRKLDTDLLLCRWMRYLAGLQRTDSDSRFAERLGELAKLAGQIDHEALHDFWQELMWSRHLLRSTSNPNIKLLLENLLMHWCALVHDYSRASTH